MVVLEHLARDGNAACIAYSISLEKRMTAQIEPNQKSRVSQFTNGIIVRKSYLISTKFQGVHQLEQMHIKQ